MRDIALASVVVTDVDNSFICRRVVYILQMKLQKLMIEYPFRLEAILHGTPHYFSRHLPVPNEVIKQSVLEDALRPIKRFLGNHMSSSRYKKPYQHYNAAKMRSGHYMFSFIFEMYAFLAARTGCASPACVSAISSLWKKGRLACSVRQIV